MEQLKILIIDDDPTVCGLLETILKMEDYLTTSVNEVANKDIISLLDKNKPDVVLMDFHLKGHETVEYMPVIRDNKDWQRLPVVMISAIDRAKVCIAAGATQFILKPFDWKYINKVVNNIRSEISNGKKL